MVTLSDTEVVVFSPNDWGLYEKFTVEPEEKSKGHGSTSRG